MDNKCPKCGKKLSIFYLKEECPECGTNILYYDMENRLEKDAENAEAEYERLYALIDKIAPKFIKKRMHTNKKTDSDEYSEPED